MLRRVKRKDQGGKGSKNPLRVTEESWVKAPSTTAGENPHLLKKDVISDVL